MDSAAQIKLQKLQQLTTLVLHPDENSEYYLQDVWQATHSRIAQFCNELLCIKGKTNEEEATICLALLMAYHVSPCLNQQKIQQVQDRTIQILPILASSSLKSHLLTFFIGDE